MTCRLSALSLAILLHSFGCSASPTPLTMNLLSGMSPGEARAVLGIRETEWKLSEIAASSDRHHVAKQAMSRYRSLGIEGGIVLEFFDDELFSVTFLPHDIDEYLKRLAAGGLPLRPATRERLPPRTEVRLDMPILPGTVPAVVWEDTRLRERYYHLISP